MSLFYHLWAVGPWPVVAQRAEHRASGPLGSGLWASGSGPLALIGRFLVGSGFNYWKPIRPERTEFLKKKTTDEPAHS